MRPLLTAPRRARIHLAAFEAACMVLMAEIAFVALTLTTTPGASGWRVFWEMGVSVLFGGFMGKTLWGVTAQERRRLRLKRLLFEYPPDDRTKVAYVHAVCDFEEALKKVAPTLRPNVRIYNDERHRLRIALEYGDETDARKAALLRRQERGFE